MWNWVLSIKTFSNFFSLPSWSKLYPSHFSTLWDIFNVMGKHTLNSLNTLMEVWEKDAEGVNRICFNIEDDILLLLKVPISSTN